MSRFPLLLISRRDLLEAAEASDGDRLIRQLASLTRRGVHLVTVASQPEEWSRSKAESKRGQGPPRRIRDRIAEAGGVLNGIYYIPQSLLTQKTRREEALRELMDRFDVEPDRCYLVSSNRSFLAVASKLGINSVRVDSDAGLSATLAELAQPEKGSG